MSVNSNREEETGVSWQRIEATMYQATRVKPFPHQAGLLSCFVTRSPPPLSSQAFALLLDFLGRTIFLYYFNVSHGPQFSQLARHHPRRRLIQRLYFGHLARSPKPRCSPSWLAGFTRRPHARLAPLVRPGSQLATTHNLLRAGIVTGLP